MVLTTLRLCLSGFITRSGSINIKPFEMSRTLTFTTSQKRGLISSAVSQGVTPEVVIEQKRRQAMQETEAEAAAVEGEQGNSSSGQRKEKKKGFLKGIFGKK